MNFVFSCLVCSRQTLRNAPNDNNKIEEKRKQTDLQRKRGRKSNEKEARQR